ncbi:kinase-like domain-containing protein [Boletus reticuloceps]|uniref:Kinase-like domain-containing protein n=1 Tax=Boletus reticuloceps TaxID=495285 RepID=A0A8I2YTN3_9AGAM|nr:kinase-like domain-containing protein [Boletus reticuloceps]
MPTSIIGPTLGAAQLAATLSGVPFAAGGVMVLQLIHAACSQVSVHKQKSAQLVQRCTTLLTFINEQSSLLVGTDVTATFDEAEAVLASVHRRVQKWAHCGKVKVLLNSAQIARDLDKCYADVDNAMERLHVCQAHLDLSGSRTYTPQVANPVAMLRMQQRSIDMMKHHQAALEETLQQLLISPREIERAVQQHISGGNAAYELMRLGQERLVGLREEAPVPSATYLSDGRQVVESPTCSRPPSPITTVQNQIEQALLDLHRLTNIPPTIPILNNQVKKTDLTVSSMKSVFGQNSSTKTVLTMLGVVTNMGSIHIVSPWQLDNVRNYRRENPDVNPLNLLIQAAKGLEYLHSQQIVHGHLKCTNMLVSEEGVVTLSDFGLTQVLTDVVGKMAMVVLTNTSAVRWHAPELNQGEDTTPTMASDVFAFSMSVLELLTMKPPYSNRRRDVSVIRDLTLGVLPPRPDEPEAVPWMSDSLWEMLNTCWKWNPEERLLAKELPSFLASESSSQL